MGFKKVTTDDLAVMVQKGFLELKTEILEEIHRLEEKIDALAAALNARLDALEKRIFKIEIKIFDSDYEKRLVRLEEAVFGKHRK